MTFFWKAFKRDRIYINGEKTILIDLVWFTLTLRLEISNIDLERVLLITSQVRITHVI